MNLPAPQTARLQAPLVIGVTGHRDLRPDDLPQLERKVKHIFERLRERYGSTPLLVLSPLAEGADRLVARVGLLDDFGARLVVPLPMPAALYEEDFEEPGSVDEFRALMVRADCAFVVPPSPDFDSIRSPGPVRDRRYELAGAYVVGQSQILIALWDGTESGKIGGTSAMVRLRTEGSPDGRQRSLQPPELFPVYQILTPRRSNPKPAGEPFRLREIYPPVFHTEEHGKTYYGKALRNLDRFNRHIREEGVGLLDEAERSKRELLGASHGQAWLTEADVLALDQYAIADALAIRYQRKTVRAHWALHVLVFLSFLCIVLFAELGEFRVWWLAASLILLCAALITNRLGRRRALDDQALDYRAVAEGARVRFFWKAAGIEDSVADNYLDEQRTELDWIRNALRGWDAALCSNDAVESENARASLEFGLKHWVDHQLHYFSKASRINRERAERIDLWVRAGVVGVLVLGLGIAGAAAAGSILDASWWEPAARDWLKWPMVAIDLLLAAGGLLHHFGERMAYSEHAKQYRRMHEVFRNAKAIIQEQLAANDSHAARACLRKLGQEALAENGDWVLLHRERPLELPHP
ncbi:MAG TPA: hypothetical protein VMH05_14545 [Bryobacteraceae bacterium]|nr:hypothetical protein [Bryobacteraceae bacterium]